MVFTAVEAPDVEPIGAVLQLDTPNQQPHPPVSRLGSQQMQQSLNQQSAEQLAYPAGHVHPLPVAALSISRCSS